MIVYQRKLSNQLDYMDWFLAIWMIISNKLTMMRYNLPSYLLCSRGSRPRISPFFPTAPPGSRAHTPGSRVAKLLILVAGWILLWLRSPKVYNPCGIFYYLFLLKLWQDPEVCPGSQRVSGQAKMMIMMMMMMMMMMIMVMMMMMVMILISSWNPIRYPNDCMVNCSCGRGALISCWNPPSSAAQGGGGSFKKRNPVGEVRCCDARMAERIHWWTERWLELCFLEWSMVAVITSPQLLDVVVCSAVIVVAVVEWSCNCGVI